MKGENRVGEGMERVLGGVRIRYGKGQERWPDNHENEWKSVTDSGRELRGTSRM